MSAAEFPRPIDVRQIGERPVTLTASETEREALARRFGLVAIHRLEAEVTLSGDASRVVAQGRMEADIVQSCAVSSEDLPVHIDEKLDLRFVPARADEAEELELAEEDCDEIPFDGEVFDLGEAVAQSLALAIDPYAVGPEADRARREAGIIEEGESGPFAALAALKKN